MNSRILRRTLWLALGLLALSAQAGSLWPPPGPASPTGPPDTCYDDFNRFVDCGDGTIKDMETGLFWLKDAFCWPDLHIGNLTWADANEAVANLAHGKCGLTDGSLPGDWRLPTLECPSGLPSHGSKSGHYTCEFSTPPTGEFATIFAPVCPAPHIPDAAGTGCWSEGNPFSGVISAYYWSATIVPFNPGAVWMAGLLDNGVYVDNKTNPRYVWPVRGGR